MSTSFYTPIDDIAKAYRSGRTKSLAFRKEQIAQVGYLVRDHEQRIIDALKSDLGRPMLESVFFDCAAIAIEVRTAYDNIEKWTKAQRAEFNLNFFALSPKMKAEPKGVVLNITPFNVPVLMILSPLVGAIAAGNAIVTKPSEQTPAVSALLAELVPQYLDRDLYPIINGGVAETTRILELEWHHILYTGNGRVGRIIAQAAAKHLTPLTLEASKNPVFVDPTYDVKTAAKRILWGRFSNAGQICLAPEYVLVPKEFQDTLVSAMKEVAESFYPEGPKKSESFSRIVSSAHAARIKRMIDETKGTVVFGGDTDVSERYIAPTVVRDVRPDDVLMGDEIFGPVLAIVPVKDVDEAIALVNARDHPLAVYVFSSDKEFQRKVSENTESGAVVYNETVLSCGVPGIPMGGVGASGYGYYTGKFMFDEFTHMRVSLDSPGWADKIALGFRYPPYKSSKQVQALMPSLPPRPGKQLHATANGNRWGFWLAFVVVGAAAVVLIKSGGSVYAQLTY